MRYSFGLDKTWGASAFSVFFLWFKDLTGHKEWLGVHCEPEKTKPKAMKRVSQMGIFHCLKNHQSFCQKKGLGMKLVWICDYNKVILLCQRVLNQFIPLSELILGVALIQVQQLCIVSFANFQRMLWILIKMPLLKNLYNIHSNMDPWRIPLATGFHLNFEKLSEAFWIWPFWPIPYPSNSPSI